MDPEILDYFLEAFFFEFRKKIEMNGEVILCTKLALLFSITYVKMARREILLHDKTYWE